MDAQEIALGARMYSRAVVLHGRMTGDGWRRFLAAVADAMGMTAVGDAAAWDYPTVDGKGGNGTTICQPITESFIVLDTWPDHDGAYLFIASCRKFSALAVAETAMKFGLTIGDASPPATLRLV